MESQLTASNLSRCQDLADRIRKLAYFRIIENLLSADLLLILMDIERDCRTNIQIKSSKMISNQIKTNQIKLLPTWRAVGPNVGGLLRHSLTTVYSVHHRSLPSYACTYVNEVIVRNVRYDTSIVRWSHC